MSGSLALTDTNRNAGGPGYGNQSIALRSGVASDWTRATLRVAPDPITRNRSLTLSGTVVDTNFLSRMPQKGGVTLTDSVHGNSVVLNGGAPVSLSGGKATLSLIPGIAGDHTITAHHAGVDGTFPGSMGEGMLLVQP